MKEKKEKKSIWVRSVRKTNGETILLKSFSSYRGREDYVIT